MGHREEDGAHRAPGTVCILPAHVEGVTPRAPGGGVEQRFHRFALAVEAAIGGRQGVADGRRGRDPGRGIDVVGRRDDVLRGQGRIIIIGISTDTGVVHRGG